jgi:beta-galactosidase
MGELAGTRVVADVALLFSWEAWWATDAENRPSSAVSYLDQVWALHRALRESGAQVDVVKPGADLSGYRLVVVPGLHLVRDEEAATLDAAVARGAHTLVTFYSGIVDEYDRVRTGGYPAVWRDLLGVRVEEFAPVLPGDVVTLESGITASLWTERLVAPDAEILDRCDLSPRPQRSRRLLVPCDAARPVGSGAHRRSGAHGGGRRPRRRRGPRGRCGAEGEGRPHLPLHHQRRRG